MISDVITQRKLTHQLPAISQTIFSTANFPNEKFCILIRNPLKCVPNVPTDDKPAVVQVVACHQIYDKPLPEPMLTQLTEANAALGRDNLTTQVPGFYNSIGPKVPMFNNSMGPVALDKSQSLTTPYDRLCWTSPRV